MNSRYHVAIAWNGLPYYAANVVGRLIRCHPDWQFTIISSRDGIPYQGIEGTIGQAVRWVNPEEELQWRELGVRAPDFFLLTSWAHPAYMSLAREARRNKKAMVVAMLDNYYHGSARQWAGALFFRLRLRGLFDRLWVPGRRSARFMRFLGMPKRRIVTGLYTADTSLFYPPSNACSRSKVIFVGQFIPRKGVSEILKALARPNGIKDRLSLIGQGVLEGELRAQGATVESFKQPVELASIYRSASALLLPSKIDHWGVVAHEAACCGCLILATKQCGCVDDLVEHGCNGYIMKESSADEIIKAFDWLRDLTPEQEALGRELSLKKAAAFSPHKWVRAFEGMAGFIG